jgi:hypothetical protein
MTKRALRSALALALPVAFAAFEAPRLVHRPAPTGELVAAPPVPIADSAVARIASGVRDDTSGSPASHLGFDTDVYPGNAAMDAWKRAGVYEWVGYYLEAPCHSDDSWSGARPHLQSTGWGLAVIYVGQQTWGKSLSRSPRRHTVTRVVYKKTKHGRRRVVRRVKVESAAAGPRTGDGCSASFVGAAQGRIDARDAIAQAKREGFAPGMVIFLDLEHMNAIPQRMRDYYSAWTQTLLADGHYRPGIYAHTRNAATIHTDVSAAFDKAGVGAHPPFWIAGSRGFAPGRVPTDVGHAFASAWQGVLDVVRTLNGFRLPIDISVASMASPSLGE